MDVCLQCNDAKEYTLEEGECIQENEGVTAGTGTGEVIGLAVFLGVLFFLLLGLIVYIMRLKRRLKTEEGPVDSDKAPYESSEKLPNEM